MCLHGKISRKHKVNKASFRPIYMKYFFKFVCICIAVCLELNLEEETNY